MNRDKCFFISPIGKVNTRIRKQFNNLKNSIKRVCENRKIDRDLISIIDISANGDINKDILEHLQNDDFCIANLTGLNANVMYELGIRVQTKKEFVVFAKRGTKLPFDIQANRTVFFDDVSKDVNKLKNFEEELKKTIIETLEKYKRENPLLKKGTENVKALLPKARYNQSISFTITDYIASNGEKYLRFRCKHVYELKKEQNDEPFDIYTFNDISIPEEVNKALPENDRTQFNSVTLLFDGKNYEEHERTNTAYESEFYFDKNGRPSFETKGISFGEHDSLTLIFDINNIHSLNAKHLWYFEQLSESLTLKIDNKSSYDCDKFKLIVYHQNFNDIKHKNQNSINDYGTLKKNQVEIKMDFLFFPYQGFELQWNLD